MSNGSRLWATSKPGLEHLLVTYDLQLRASQLASSKAR
uniref:Uncharacterized protein n=1 Tax=Tetraselmis sp. GSL018 TaxID=582737 RepID=A0A061SNB4_9CHLO